MNEILNESVDYTSAMSVPNDRLTSQIIGAGIEVHRKLGPKLLESIYQRSMEIELDRRGVPFRAQAPVPVFYKDEFVGDFYADLIVAERVVVELKAVERLNNAHLAQMLSYLESTKLRLGLIMNFNETTLVAGLRRVIR